MEPIYVVTDIEVDGPWPGANSMLAFGSVAVNRAGERFGEFEGVLSPLPGAQGSPPTLEWWRQFPEAWAASTAEPQPAGEVMGRFAAWVKELPGPAIFAAHPLAFDGAWIDHYLRRFTSYGICQGPYEEDRLFLGSGALCLHSMAVAVLGRGPHEISSSSLPDGWLGDVEHTHRAIDDARGYAHLLVELFARSGTAVAPE